MKDFFTGLIAGFLVSAGVVLPWILRNLAT